MKGELINIKTGFLYCPRCGLRKPKPEIMDYYSGYCPACGCRMIEEAFLPYKSLKKYSAQIPHSRFNLFMNYS
ncbi:MAG: hypothetical protein EHM47_07605 [Ignavibacteriales bacterium]|nr:MAG: hypothetical protein EHM47_07605 [Ignavibacteriales bacterium]